MKLAHWSLHFYRLPYVREVRWVFAAESSGDYALLTIVADNGTAGVAEGVIKPTRTGTSPRSLVAALETVILPQIQGLDLLSEEAVTGALARVPENRLAKAMVDNACWSLRAGAAGKPLWQLLGGKPEVDLAYILTRQTPERMAAEAGEACARHGFRTLKVQGGQGRDTDLRMLAEVRAAVGAEVALYVDANGSYARPEAADYVRALADAGVRVAEDPCVLAPDAGFEALQRESPLPILVDLSCTSAADAELYFGRGARAVAAKPARIGLSEARAVDAVAAARGGSAALAVYYESALGTLLSLQLAGALASPALLPPSQTFFLLLAARVTKDLPRIRDGKLRLPDEPSLETLVDWDAVKRLKP
ncbi:MAG TPA: mandelate racemase/muconate lactonizing enzyme family protein [Burkholderiales bacterium]|nr:mandelate racemase/muconate lactonizing enzyme family protein [Burkholderiales bacterium]